MGTEAQADGACIWPFTLSSSEGNNAWSYASTLPIRLHGVIINQRDNFNFILPQTFNAGIVKDFKMFCVVKLIRITTLKADSSQEHSACLIICCEFGRWWRTTFWVYWSGDHAKIERYKSVWTFRLMCSEIWCLFCEWQIRTTLRFTETGSDCKIPSVYYTFV